MKRLINRILLHDASKKRKVVEGKLKKQDRGSISKEDIDTLVQFSAWQEHKCEIFMFEEKLQQSYFSLGGEKFNQAKDTIIFFPGNCGAKSCLGMLQYSSLKEYNIVLLDYVGGELNLGSARDGYNIPEKIKYLTFDDVANAAEKTVDRIIEENKIEKGKVILCGMSLGSMVATRVAARNEKAKNNLFKYVLNLAPPMNCWGAFRKICKNPIINLSILCVYGVLVGISYGVLYASSSHIKLNNKPSLLIASSLCIPIILLGLFLLLSYKHMLSAGVAKSDIDSLKEQKVKFVQVKGDELCDEEYTKSFIRGKNNIEFKLFDITREKIFGCLHSYLFDGLVIYEEVKSCEEKPNISCKKVSSQFEEVVQVRLDDRKLRYS